MTQNLVQHSSCHPLNKPKTKNPKILAICGSCLKSLDICIASGEGGPKWRLQESLCSQCVVPLLHGLSSYQLQSVLKLSNQCCRFWNVHPSSTYPFWKRGQSAYSNTRLNVVGSEMFLPPLRSPPTCPPKRPVCRLVRRSAA
jgi:hypothetical protein